MTTEKPRLQTPTQGPTQTPADRAEFLALDAVNRFSTEKPSTIGIGRPPVTAFARRGFTTQIAINQTVFLLYLEDQTEVIEGPSTSTIGSGIGNKYGLIATVEQGLPTTWAQGEAGNQAAWVYANGVFNMNTEAHPVVASVLISGTAIVDVADVTLAFELYDNQAANVVARSGEFRVKNVASPVDFTRKISVDTRGGAPYSWWRLLPDVQHSIRLVRTDVGPNAQVTLRQMTIEVGSYGMALP